MSWYLGIDTSAYMTSMAIVDDQERLIVSERRPLPVETGQLGLRQSEAVFHHVRNLPEVFARASEALQDVPADRICAVAASVRPRDIDGSYMPVFTAGESFGRSLAAVLRVPFVPADHQSGHLLSGAWSVGLEPRGETIAVHLSGGTTEFLLLNWGGTQRPGTTVSVQLLGGTSDLAAGQFVDRAGVALGLPFPAGPHLERIALQSTEDAGHPVARIPSSVRGYDVSFSGPAAAAERMVQQGAPAGQVARAVFGCVANTLEKVLRRAVQETGIRRILVVGGVAANSLIRERLRERLVHRAVAAEISFGSVEFSGDNAVGVALKAARTMAGGEAPSVGE